MNNAALYASSPTELQAAISAWLVANATAVVVALSVTSNPVESGLVAFIIYK